MILRRLILSGLIVFLSACGFQLRGFASLPDHISNMQLLADSLTTVQQQNLIQQLQRSGATLHGGDGDRVRLQVSIKSLPEHNLVDSAGSGQVVVRLSRQLNYSLLDTTGQRLVDNKQLLSKLDLELDENNLLGFESEKQSALEEIDDALFNQMMAQLRRL